MSRGCGFRFGCLGGAVLLSFMTLAADLPVGPQVACAQGPLIVDGDFELNESGNQLRRREADQGWYESRNRKGPKEARLLLKLSTKNIGGNSTRKAVLKADLNFNTYLSQVLAEPQTHRFSLQWDVYVKEILPPFNRSAFQLIGNASVRGRGPNGSGPERFVFLGFENAEAAGKINLFAFDGRDPDQWDNRTLLVPNLAIKKWHTVRVDVDVEKGTYLVSIPGVTPTPIEVQAFRTKKKGPPKSLTHLSFATWDDGPGTFYIDNVVEP